MGRNAFFGLPDLQIVLLDIFLKSHFFDQKSPRLARGQRGPPSDLKNGTEDLRI